MRFEDINRRFTEKVSEYMAQGYIINTATMGGSQGEIGKIDLTDGREIVRILLTNEHEYEHCMENTTCHDFNRVVLIAGVAQPENRCTPNSPDTWNGRLDVIFREEFYEIGGRYGDTKWYGTREEAIAQQDKHWKRYDARRIEDRVHVTDNPKVREIVMRAVRRTNGMKTAKESEIARIVRRHTDKGVRYEVSIRRKDVVIQAK